MGMYEHSIAVVEWNGELADEMWIPIDEREAFHAELPPGTRVVWFMTRCEARAYIEQRETELFDELKEGVQRMFNTGLNAFLMEDSTGALDIFFLREDGDMVRMRVGSWETIARYINARGVFPDELWWKEGYQVLRVYDAVEGLPSAVSFYARDQLVLRGAVSRIMHDISLCGLHEAFQAVLVLVARTLPTCRVALGDPDADGLYQVEMVDEREPTREDIAYIEEHTEIARCFGMPVRWR